MGNQVPGAERHDSLTPKKTRSQIITTSDGRRSKSSKKDGLYADEKLFENFETIYGYRLGSDPEDREFYVNCPNCGKLNLDDGLRKNLPCKTCKVEFDAEEVENNTNILIRKEKKIRELSNVVIIPNKDTLSELNIYCENDVINYDLLMKMILLPYFKIKSRIIKKNMFFKIGEIDFKVIGCSPCLKGVISSKTFIRCNNFYSLKTSIKRALMITTIKYDNFDHDCLRKEVLSTNDPRSLLINKNEVAQMKQYEFYIKNCEPSTGLITEETQLSIENRDINNITKLKIAVIKNNVPKFSSPMEKRNYEDYVIKEYFKPYFLSGNRKYIERGDIFTIEDIEMFVLNSSPEKGFINSDTNVMLKLGLNKEKCLEKINLADDKFAFNLLNNEESVRETSSDLIESNLIGRVRSLDEMLMTGYFPNRLNFDDIHLGNLIMSMSQQGINDQLTKNLPTFNVSQDYLHKINCQKDEVTKKCVVCMEHFELCEVIKTLPCFHIFHACCIDEWLNSNHTCPICKSSIADNTD